MKKYILYHLSIKVGEEYINNRAVYFVMSVSDTTDEEWRWRMRRRRGGKVVERKT